MVCAAWWPAADSCIGRRDELLNRDLVDLHNHIVYGVDDGAVSLEESLDIARQFVAEGVTRIAATPHFNSDNPRARRGADASMVRARIEELQPALDRAGINLAAFPGNEIYLTAETPDLLARGVVSPLGGGRSVLVELPLGASQRPLYLDDLIFRMQLSGQQVVLAHPERYPFVEHDVATLDTLVHGGLVLQLTAPSLLGEYGGRIRRTAEGLIRRGAYSLASSDRHHPGQNRSLAALHERISRLADGELADVLLCENPARILADKPLVPVQPLPDTQLSFLDRLRTLGGS